MKLDRLVSNADPGVFYGGDVQANYSISWILVHYLLHGDDGAHADAFVRYLEAEAKGEGGSAGLYHELGMSAEELEAGFLTYAKKVKTR